MEESDKLFEAVLHLYSYDEAKRFFSDLFTGKELTDLSQRLQIAILLQKRLSYRQISKETGASTTTVTRVNNALKNGSDGLKLALSRLSSIENNDAVR